MGAERGIVQLVTSALAAAQASHRRDDERDLAGRTAQELTRHESGLAAVSLRTAGIRVHPTIQDSMPWNRMS